MSICPRLSESHVIWVMMADGRWVLIDMPGTSQVAVYGRRNWMFICQGIVPRFCGAATWLSQQRTHRNPQLCCEMAESNAPVALLTEALLWRHDTTQDVALCEGSLDAACQALFVATALHTTGMTVWNAG